MNLADYNGGVWFAGGSLISIRCSLAGSGTSTTALAFGGGTGDVTRCTERATQGTAVCTFSGSIVAPPYPY